MTTVYATQNKMEDFHRGCSEFKQKQEEIITCLRKQLDGRENLVYDLTQQEQ